MEDGIVAGEGLVRFFEGDLFRVVLTVVAPTTFCPDLKGWRVEAITKGGPVREGDDEQTAQAQEK